MKTDIEDNLREILIWKSAIQSDLRRITSLVNSAIDEIQINTITRRRRRQILADNTEEKINEI